MHIHYLCLTIVAAVDIALTWTILQMGGTEVNPIADVVIQEGGLKGMIGFKFICVVLVIQMCEYVGRRQLNKGLWLSRSVVGISSVPVFVGALHITLYSLDFLR